MRRPVSLTFFALFFLVLALAALLFGTRELGRGNPAIAAPLLAWGLWAGFDAAGLLAGDDACRRGILWLATLDLGVAGAAFLLAVRGSSLEEVVAALLGPLLFLPLLLGLNLASMFVLSNWRAVEYCSRKAAHAH